MELFRLTLFPLVLACNILMAADCEVRGPSGESWTVHLSDSAKISDLKKEIEDSEGIPEEEQELWLDNCRIPDNLAVKMLDEAIIDLTDVTELPEGEGAGEELKPEARDYWKELEDSERSMIREQVIEIANSSLARLLWLKSHLEGIEAQINHVHPLRYLLYCFEEEETKVAMRNVRKRGGFVWHELDKRISHSLRQEKEAGNLKMDQIQDMAKELGIDWKPLVTPVDACDAGALMSKLIELVPRKGDYRRYDM